MDKQYADMVVQAGSDESRVIHTLWTQMLSRELLTTLNENTELFLAEGEVIGHLSVPGEGGHLAAEGLQVVADAPLEPVEVVIKICGKHLLRACPAPGFVV